MYVFGGTQEYHHSFNELHALNLDTWVWEAMGLANPSSAPSSALKPPGCFSHTLTAVRDQLVLAGGCHTLGAGLFLVPIVFILYAFCTHSICILYTFYDLVFWCQLHALYIILHTFYDLAV